MVKTPDGSIDVEAAASPAPGRYRVPKGTGDRPATEWDGALPRLRRGPMPAPFAHPWEDYDVIVIPGPEAGAPR